MDTTSVWTRDDEASATRHHMHLSPCLDVPRVSARRRATSASRGSLIVFVPAPLLALHRSLQVEVYRICHIGTRISPRFQSKLESEITTESGMLHLCDW
jgi:hypothetical protein